MRYLLALLVATVAFEASGAPTASDPDYALVASWRLEGGGGWDYLTFDAPRHRLFVTRADHVDVLDANTGRQRGLIPGTAGVHGVALAPKLGLGFSSNGRSNSVTVFRYASLAVRSELSVPGENPDAILYEPKTRRLFLFNGRSHDATVVDASTLKVLTQLRLPDKPEFAVEDGAGHVYVNIESKPGQLVVIDAAQPAVTATWPLPGCAEPTGLAIDRAHRRLFSTCDERTLAVTDADSGRSVARLQIGEHPDAAEYDAEHGLVFSSNGDGTLTIIRQLSADNYAAPMTLVTKRGARTMAFDPAGRRVYLITADFAPPPAASAGQPAPRPQPVPGSVTILVAAPRTAP